MLKNDNKKIAQKLRFEGKTYSEILDVVPVAKSTLSIWLREIGLSKKQKQRITIKKILGRKRGAEAQRNKRIKSQQKIIDSAISDIDHISRRELWLIGISLYWAEGSKEKEYRIGQRTSFSNSDPNMIKVYIKWLLHCVGVDKDDISGDLYIHKSHVGNIDEIIGIWADKIGCSRNFIKHVYYKRGKVKTVRKNTGVLYIGLLRVNIKSSSALNRKIMGWIKGIYINCGLV